MQKLAGGYLFGNHTALYSMTYYITWSSALIIFSGAHAALIVPVSIKISNNGLEPGIRGWIDLINEAIKENRMAQVKHKSQLSGDLPSH